MDNKELMMKVSRRMGGLLREAKMKSEKLRKQPLTLQEACKFGDIRALQRYLSETESDLSMRDIDARDNKGITCLGYAIGGNRLNIVKLLLDSEADPARVDSQGNTGLHYSAAYGRKDMSEYLLSRGLDINAKNLIGMTPLDCAQRNKQKITIQLFKEKGGL